MRQFILAKTFGTGTASGNLSTSELEVGGKPVLSLVLNRTNAEGGNILYPVFPKDFTWNVAPHAAAAQFSVTITVPEDIDPYLDYSVIFTKKGKLFNERSNWTATVHTTASDTNVTVATKIAKFVNDNSASLGLTAVQGGSTNANVVTITGPTTGEDYAVIAADELPKSAVNVTTKGKTAFMDAAMVKDLALKCAADAGFEYTEESDGIYPGYPVDVPAGNYKVYTLRFTEPRQTGTREEAVYQIIQIAFPSSADTADLETLLASVAEASK